MLRPLSAVVFVSLLVVSVRLHAQDGVVVEGELGTRIREFVEQAHTRAEFTGSVLAARDGRVIAAVSFGRTNGPGSSPISPTTLFEIASTTKAIAAVAVMHLQEAGRLKLDDPIDRHLQGVPENCRAITIRHLLQHTSGIPNTNQPDWHDDFDSELPLMLAGGPRSPPGTVGQYWNGGYAILSEIVSRASGRSFQDYCREAIFDPCGMSASRFTGDPQPVGSVLATGSTEGQPSRTALDHPYPHWKYRAMGGMVTNVWDLWRLDRALADHRLLSKKSIQQMISDPINGYGLGWEIAEAADGKAYQRHSGSVRGFLSMYCRFPHMDGCLIIQCNRLSEEQKTTMFEMTKGCEQLLLGKPLNVSFPEPLPPELGRQLSGRFENTHLGILTVLPNGRSHIDWTGGQKTMGRIQVSESQEAVFMDQTSAPIKLQLQKDGTGQVIGIILLQSEFVRVPDARPTP